MISIVDELVTSEYRTRLSSYIPVSLPTGGGGGGGRFNRGVGGRFNRGVGGGLIGGWGGV